jgi:AraC-like DNA-binding protein
MFVLNLIYISLVFFMIVFSLHLMLTRHGNLFINRMLAIMLMARSFQYLYGWLTENGHLSELMFVYKVPNALLFIAPSAYYLYIKGFVTDQYKLGKYEWLHFLPGLIGLAEAIPWVMSSQDYRNEVLHAIGTQQSFFAYQDPGFMTHETSLMIRTCMFLVYIGASWVLVLRKGIFKSYASNRIGCNWVLLLLILATFGHSLVLSAMIWDQMNPELGHAGFLGAVRVSILIYICNIMFIFYQPRVMYGYAFVAASLDPPGRNGHHAPEVWQSFRFTEPDSRTNTSGQQAMGDANDDPLAGISRERIDRWKRSLLNLMEQEKPFLNPAFRLHNLAETLDIAPHHCSYLINIEFGKNFNQWVNEHRIEHFINLYQKNASTHTLEALAHEAGFSNRRTLHNAFLKVHGQPPGTYLQQHFPDRQYTHPEA